MGYMRSRDAIEKRLAYMMEVQSLVDNNGMREAVPDLMLRLGKDQEMYDFVWGCCKLPQMLLGQFGEFGGSAKSFRKIKGADALGDVDYLCRRDAGLEPPLLIGVTLLKVKLMLGLNDVRNAQVLKEKLPQEVVDIIKGIVSRSQIVAGNKKLIDMDSKENLALTSKLKDQIRALWDAVNVANEHFWPMLLYPLKHLPSAYEIHPPGSVKEAKGFILRAWEAWWEVPGAIGIVRIMIESQKRR